MSSSLDNAVIVSTSIHRLFAEGVSRELGVPLIESGVRRFANGEVVAQIEENVRRKHVFLVGPISRGLDGQTPNDALMELLVVADALVRASVERLSYVIPYFGYGKQDRKVAGRQPITARLVADLLVSAAPTVNRLITVDLHNPAIQGFFRIPVDALTAQRTFVDYLKTYELGGDSTVVIAPDAGGVVRARLVSEAIGSPMAVIFKQRLSEQTVRSTDIVGNVTGKRCVIIDDLVQSGGTLVADAELLMKRGATDVLACVTHFDPIGEATAKIDASPISKLVVTDTHPFVAANSFAIQKLQIQSIQPLVASAIRRNEQGESVSELFR